MIDRIRKEKSWLGFRAMIENNMKHSTLVVLAGGLGSRFGGNKQITSVGPSGECLMEYSIYDAIEAGFDHVVFV